MKRVIVKVLEISCGKEDFYLVRYSDNTSKITQKLTKKMKNFLTKY